MTDVVIRELGCVGYTEAWEAMRRFTDRRVRGTPDELWVLEHPPVYTLGLGGRREHLHPEAASIPLVRSDRGGQVTYHGPGQAIVYALVDLRARGVGVRGMVHLLEEAVIAALAAAGVTGARRAGAPGVYVHGRKIAALGLRVRGGCTYHGVALNVDVDLAPFSHIDPCGYAGLEVTSLARLGIPGTAPAWGLAVAERLRRALEATRRASAV